MNAGQHTHVADSAVVEQRDQHVDDIVGLVGPMERTAKAFRLAGIK